MQCYDVTITERGIKILGIQVIDTTYLFPSFREVLIEKVCQDANAVCCPDMGGSIDIKWPELQEGLDMLEGVFDLGLVPVGLDDFTSRKRKDSGLIMDVCMIGDKDTDAIKTFNLRPYMLRLF